MIIPFKDISIYSTERLSTLPARDVIDSLIEALNIEADKCSVLHFAFTKCIDTMPLNDINQRIFKQMLPVMQTMYRMSISNYGRQQWTREPLSTCIQLMSTLLTNMTAAIKRQAELVRFTCLGELPMFCARFLSEIFDVISSNNDAELQTLSKCARNAHSLLLLLFTSGNLTIDSCDEHLAYVEQILLDVSFLAILQSNLDDMKLMADTWKCLMALSAKFASSLNENYSASLKWFDRSVETICTYLQNIMNDIRQDPMDDKKLKVSIFFAKVLQKIFGDQKTQLHRANCHRHFIEMLRTYYEIKISHNSNNKISPLNEPLLACLRFIVGHKVTAELLLGGSSHGNHYICIEIVKMLLKTTSHDDLYLDKVESRNLLHYLVFTCGAETSILLKSSGELYGEIVFHCAALMISKAANSITSIVLERVLAAAIVQENIHIGYLALDIWILYSRHIPSGKKLQYYKYWSKVNMLRSPQCHSVSNSLIKSLLRILFISMPTVLQTYIVNRLRSTDFATILAIGWNQISKCDPNISRNLLQSMNNDISKFLAQLMTCKDPQSYYQLAHVLTCVSKGIECSELTIDRTLTSKLKNLLTKDTIEHHIELFTAIIEYLTASNQQHSIAGDDKIPAIITTVLHLKCLKIALCQPSNAESKHPIEAILDDVLKRHRETDDSLEKILIMRVLCQLNTVGAINLRSDQKIDIDGRIEACRQEQRTARWLDESSEGQYYDKIVKNVLTHKCEESVADNDFKLQSNQELTRILDTMDIQAQKLEKLYHSQCLRVIDCQTYSIQIDRIVNCLKLFKK